MYNFKNDYSEGACPAVLKALVETNDLTLDGYCEDVYCTSATEKIRAACACPDAEVYYAVGGTPCNLMVIAHALRAHEAPISCDTGHINGHECGAVEASGHKILTVPNVDGKLDPALIEALMQDYQDIHVVKPKLVYISQPTELGTLYTKAELIALHEFCKAKNLYLYCDGARLASALAAKDNDVFLPDLAALCDAFYIGGTKCGALFGEAIVFSNTELAAEFGYVRKQRGGLLAKGRLIGVQFDAMMTDGVYEATGAHMNRMADLLRDGLTAKGVKMLAETTTNQVFPIFSNADIERLSADFAFHTWAKVDAEHTAIRLVTSWATKEEAALAFVAAV